MLSGAFCFSHERNSQFSSSCSCERCWILDRSVSISCALSCFCSGGFLSAAQVMIDLHQATTQLKSSELSLFLPHEAKRKVSILSASCFSTMNLPRDLL